MVFGRTDEIVPVIGFGTWKIGGGWYSPDNSHDKEAIEAMRLAIELGSTFVDTAEAYGGGHTEELVGKALSKVENSEVFVATKVSPEHLHYDDVIKSCKASLNRLGVKQIDLYQVHWPNPSIPISETMRAFEYLVDKGFIRYIGVSNFSVELFEEAQSSLHKYEIQSNQVSYSFFDRKPERDGVLDYCKRNKVTLIAYSPLGKGKVSSDDPSLKKVDELAKKYEKTRAQILLSWLVHKGNVLPIPKAIKPEHIRENCEAGDLVLSESDYSLLD
jgi:diketogulonate reductase-like aldo/keto reductase